MATLTKADIEQLVAQAKAKETSLQRSVSAAKGRVTAAQNEHDQKAKRLATLASAREALEAALAAMDGDLDLEPEAARP